MTQDFAIHALLVAAALMQILAATVAARLEPIGGMRRWWFLITGALIIQAGRRVFELTMDAPLGDVLAACAISGLLLAGVLGISKTFERERRTRSSLSEERDRDETYSHYADVAIVVLDEHARIRHMNPTACALAACQERDALDKDWFDTFVPEPARTELRERFMRLMASQIEDDAYVEYEFVDAKGQDHSVVWHRRVLRDADGHAVGARSAGVDLTEQRRLEEVLRVRNEHNQSLLRLYASLGCANSYREIVAALLDEIPETLGYSGATLLIVDDDRSHVRIPQGAGSSRDGAHGIAASGEPCRGEPDDDSYVVLPVGDDPFLKEILEATHTIVVREANAGALTDNEVDEATQDRTIISVPLILAGRMVGALNTGTSGDDGVRPPSQAQLDYLDSLANHVAVAMARVQFLAAEKEAASALRHAVDDAEAALDGVVKALASTTGERDLYTSMHQERVAQLACAMAEEMRLPPQTVEGIRISAVLHDIGKIAVPTGILAKPGALSEMEFGIIRAHSEVGHRLLENVPFHAPVATIVRQHHERLDGSGYPDGLHGNEILPEARIIAVADVVVAMASHRPYRASLGIDAARDEIVRGAGTLFDADAVSACLRVLDRTQLSFAVDPFDIEPAEEPRSPA